MAIEKCLIVLQHADLFPTQREYRDYQSEIKHILGSRINRFSSLEITREIDFREPESALILLQGKGQGFDIMVIEDFYPDIAAIYKQCEKNNSLKKVLVADHPNTVEWLLDKNIPAPRLVTLDFRLLEDDEYFRHTQRLFEKIKAKWNTTCVIGLTNNENQAPARELEDKIRGGGESVWDKEKFMENLSHIFRDRLRMHELRTEVIALQEKNKSLEAENKKLKSQLPTDSGKAYLRGSSNEMRNVYAELEKIRGTRMVRAILVQGSPGTGKNIVAKAIAEDMEIIPENCYTVRCTELNENYLRGYVKGAFPGAEIGKEGLLTRFSNGILILDGIENLAMDVQEQLIDVLDNGKFTKQGSFDIENTSTRFVFLSTNSVEGLLKAGKLKQELYYRISFRQINLPDLKSRKDDINDLIDYFLTDQERLNKYFGAGDWVFSFEKEAKNYLMYHDFPGNVAELEKIVMMAMEQAFHSRKPGSGSNFVLVGREHVAAILSSVPSEDEIEEVELFLNRVEADANQAVKQLQIPPEKLKQKHLADVTNNPHYRQNTIQAFLKVKKREEIAKYLLSKYPERWKLLRRIKPFEVY